MAEMSQNLKDLVETKISFLASRLSAEDWAEMQAVFAGTATAEDEVPDDGILGPRDPNNPRDRDDKRPAAMDAKTAAAFDALYPGVKMPNSDTMGMRKAEKLGAVTSQASESFQATYPGAVPTRSV